MRIKYIVLLTTSLFMISSCEFRNSKKIIIDDFSKPIHDSGYIENNSYGSYMGSFYHLKGYVNDSSFFKYNKNHYPILINGNIDTAFYVEDYANPKLFNIYVEPYKSTKGKVEIEYGIWYYPF